MDGGRVGRVDFATVCRSPPETTFSSLSVEAKVDGMSRITHVNLSQVMTQVILSDSFTTY